MLGLGIVAFGANMYGILLYACVEKSDQGE